MARVKRGVTSHARHKKVLEQVKGSRGRAKNTIRVARQRLEKDMQYAYRDRRVRKRQFRALWIQRINAAARAGARVQGGCGSPSPRLYDALAFVVRHAARDVLRSFRCRS